LVAQHKQHAQAKAHRRLLMYSWFCMNGCFMKGGIFCMRC